MARLVRIKLKGYGDDGRTIGPNVEAEMVFSPGTGLPKEEWVTLASGFNALTAPSGATAVTIFTEETVSLTLKGITGDTGIALTPASNVKKGFVHLPVSSPSIGLAASGAATIRVLWW